MADTVKEVIERVAQQVKTVLPDLSIYVLLHGAGQKVDQLALETPDIEKSVAGGALHALYRKFANEEKSAFHGLATARRWSFLKFKTVRRYQAAISINLDDYETDYDRLFKFYMLLSEALDFTAQHLSDQTKNLSPILIPTSTARKRSRQIIRSRAFASVMMCMDGHVDAIEEEARQSAYAPLIAKPGFVPEENAFALAAETLRYAYDTVFRTVRQEAPQFLAAYSMAKDIALSVDENTLRAWRRFAYAAQDMAWRGYAEANILSAALTSGRSNLVRAIAYQVAEITDVKPASSQAVINLHNPFASIQDNEKIHNKMVSDIFEKAMERGFDEGSAQPLYEIANEQNARLMRGQVLGWCASGLQAAAKAFEISLQTGREPLQSAWLEFEGHRTRDVWAGLQKVARRVLGHRRLTHGVSIEDVRRIVGDVASGTVIQNSIKATLKDPAFQASYSMPQQGFTPPLISPTQMFSPAAVPSGPKGATVAPPEPRTSLAHLSFGPSLGLGTSGAGRAATQGAESARKDDKHKK